MINADTIISIKLFIAGLIASFVPTLSINPPTDLAQYAVWSLQFVFFGAGALVFINQYYNQRKVYKEDLVERELKRKVLETEIEYLELKKQKLK